MTATMIVSLLLAALLTLTAVRKLSHREDVVESYAAVGVPEERLNALALVLLAGAAGLLVGLAWRPIGIAAASGVIAYFAVAVAFHIRAGDARHLATPFAFAAIAVAALVLGLQAF